jgi:signal transduction histidine kinase
VALRWRIRHKLLLGLGVVVGIIAILLAGSLQGLAAFTATVKTADSKLVELNSAEEFYRCVGTLKAPAAPDLTIDDYADKVHAKLATAEKILADYDQKLDAVINKQRDFDPDDSDHEKGLVRELRLQFAALHEALTNFVNRPRQITPGEADKLADDPAFHRALTKVEVAADQLRYSIYHHLFRGLDRRKDDLRRSVAIVLATSIAGVLLTAGMVRFFYKWLFGPIRDLQQGVDRITRGDFSHRIELHSSDELQDLAAAFNEMSAQLHGTYRDLADEVQEQGQQLVRSERLASVGFLAAGVAHEINNPLASIAFCAEGLERRLAELLGRFPREHEPVQKYLRMIQDEAFRCKQITGHLLEFARVGEGERRPTDLAEVVQSVLDMVQHLPNAHGKRIVFRPAGRPAALASAHEIKQVVLNVVVNALDSMDEGGVLTITLAPNGPAAEMIFADSGCGMPPDVLDNIFEPFFTRSRSGKGTGLGLSISHRIISQHGGAIEASSPGPGQGSTFVVRLPLQSRGADATPLPTVKEVAVGHAAAA